MVAAALRLGEVRLVSQLYNEDYAPVYRALYLEHPMWSEKNATNLRLLDELLDEGSHWLDTCCGQAWQLGHKSDVARRVGVDLSAAQLAIARENAPGVELHCADILAWEPGERFDLCSNFWGALSYLGTLDQLRAALGRLISWTRPGGAIYLELITPSLLSQFNMTPFARENQCTVEVAGDTWRWSYTDPAGRHELVSPPVDFYIEALSEHFRHVEHRCTVAAMAQLVAKDRIDHV